MAEALGGIRQKLSRAAEMAKAVKRLHDTGIVDLGNLGVTLETVKNVARLRTAGDDGDPGRTQISVTACGRRRARDPDLPAGRRHVHARWRVG